MRIGERFGSRSARRALATILATAVGVTCLAGRALACDRPERPDGPVCEPDRGDARPSVAGVRLDAAVVKLSRIVAPAEPAGTDCDEGSRIALQARFELEGFEPWPRDVAVRVDFPRGGVLEPHSPMGPTWLQPSSDGSAGFALDDEPERPIDASLVFTAVGCGSHESRSVEVGVAEPAAVVASGASEDADAGDITTGDIATGDIATPSLQPDATPPARTEGCSFSTTTKHASSSSVLGVLAVMLRRRARRAPLRG